MKATNRQRALFRSLRDRKGRDESGLFMVEGVRLCEELLGAGLPVEMVMIAEEATSAIQSLVARFQAAGGVVLEARQSEIVRISDTVTSQGILAAARWKDTPFSALQYGERSRLIALDAVSDPGNVGTVVRCADWFGADAVLLGRGCVDLLNPKTVRATMGGMFHLPVCRNVPLEDALPDLKRRGFKVTAATMDGSPAWREWCAPSRSVLVLGSEARGLSDAVLAAADRRVTIPGRGRGESLNVAVAAGIFLSALAR